MFQHYMKRAAMAAAWGVSSTLVGCMGNMAHEPQAEEDVAVSEQELGGTALGICRHSDSWTNFTGDDANTRCVERDEFVDETNVSGLAASWDWVVTGDDGTEPAPTERAVTGTPVLHDGVMYVGDWTGKVRALDATTGEELWATQTAVTNPFNPRPAQVNSSVAVHGDEVYALGTDTLYRLDKGDGSIVWSSIVNTHFITSNYSSPIVVEDKVVMGVAGVELVLPLCEDTGGAPPCVDEYTFRGSVVAFDRETGTEQWRVLTTENDGVNSGAGVSVWSSAAIDKSRQLMYIGTGNSYTAPASDRSDAVMAINYQTGTVQWVTQVTEGDAYTVPARGPGPDADIGATPNLFRIGDQDVVGVGGKDGSYTVFDRDTGEVVWQTELGFGSPLGGIMVSSAYADGTVFVTSNIWPGLVQDPLTGCVVDGTHFFLDTGITYALDAATGAIKWATYNLILPPEIPQSADPADRNTAPMLGAMLVANGVVYNTSIDNRVYARSAEDGSLLWSDTLPSIPAGGLSVEGDTLYVPFGLSFRACQGTTGGVRAYQ